MEYRHTGISKAYWCKSDGDFKPAESQNLKSDKTALEISWLDILLEGGILVPKNSSDEDKKKKSRALTMLITGPPGSGKSTLALELCYNWTRAFNNNQEEWSSIYLTSETEPDWAIQKARAFGWNDVNNRILSHIKDDNNRTKAVHIWHTNEFQEIIDSKKTPFLEAIESLFSKKPAPSRLVKAIKRKWKTEQFYKQINKNKHCPPDVIVIDSLNTAPTSQRSELYNKFMPLMNLDPKVIITIVESDNTVGSEFWEYISDIVIRLDKKRVSDYLLRSLEITKSRNQAHVWGTHQLKIYPEQKLKNSNSYDNVIKRRRAHPYREEGGIFIFPSIHYYLSAYKRSSPVHDSQRFEVPIKSLKEILVESFPKGRCTGFIGSRGSHKSHLGYLNILSQVTRNKNERALIISLRDDEGITKQTLKKIIDEEPDISGDLDTLLESDKIEIMYFPPGYITPEEFFHRIYRSLQRLKKDTGKDGGVAVLFNSLDQLSSRFPLCAREKILIPGIIETLSADGITSFFIAVEEPGQPPEQYGLLSMADAIISFTHEFFTKDDYCSHLNKYLKYDEKDKSVIGAIEDLTDPIETTVMRVNRFAGGRAPGAFGILELIHHESRKRHIFDKIGLNFIPISK